MVSIGPEHAERKQRVALAVGFATMSGADRLIGGGVVGFLLPSKGLAGKEKGRGHSRNIPTYLVFAHPSKGTGCATHSPIREGACKIRGGDSTRYSAHSSRSANAQMKTLDGLRPQPLT